MKLTKLLQEYASAAQNTGRVKSLSDIKGSQKKDDGKDVGGRNPNGQKSANRPSAEKQQSLAERILRVIKRRRVGKRSLPRR